MNFLVPRTCTEVAESPSGHADTSDFAGSKPLSDYRSASAYVLLGNPGFGKTTEFERERKELGGSALVVSARDFIALDAESHPEWTDKTLFIDGLDEVRSAGGDARVPLDEIRNRLDKLRPPAFRISCREADWLGHSDRGHLGRVSNDQQVSVLRLDELKHDQVLELLRRRHGRTADEAHAFVAEACHRGVDGLLANPLTLGLLVGAVGEGDHWPDSRRDTLEMACLRLAAEHNEEHAIGSQVGGGPRPQTVVDAAGYVCTLSLLAGIEGFQLHSTGKSSSFAPLSELEEPLGQLSVGDLEYALSTKLFKALSGGFAPLHRQVAEFLAGRYLAKVIGEGLPARRVVALMTGPSDGGVVTSLRGLSAWLASHSSGARELLIEVDPIGVGLYGDISNLAVGERKRLLESLAAFFEDNPQLYLGLGDEIARAFRSLATAEMLPELKNLLSCEVESAAQGRLLEMILEVLARTEDPLSVASLEDDLETILWGETCTVPIRARALDAYLHLIDSSEERTRSLRRVLDAIQDGSMEDPDDQIRGTLLLVLYPQEVTPAELWRYMLPHNRNFFGNFRKFWERTLIERSSAEHFAELLDALNGQLSNLGGRLEQHIIKGILMKLLASCLEVNSEIRDDPKRLYVWLASVGEFRGRPRQDEPTRRVRTWLEDRPEVQKQLVLVWLREGDPESHPFGEHGFLRALHGSRLPPDFGLWCLKQAVQIAEDEPETAKRLVWHAHRSLDDPSRSDGLTLETMRERTRGCPVLAEYLADACERLSVAEEGFQREEDRFEQQMAEDREQWQAEQRKIQKDWTIHLRDHEQELRGNRFAPQNLSTLAEVSLGLLQSADSEVSPNERISKFLGGEMHLVDAVKVALLAAPWRDDVPEVKQTISLSLESRRSTLAYPVLAGIDLVEKEDPGMLDGLSGVQKRKVLAVYYCVPHSVSAPRWHRRWLEVDPQLVLDVLFECVAAEVRAGKDFSHGLHVLEDVEGFDELVNDVRLRLLEAFPTRSSKRQLKHLDPLLSGALEYRDNATLLSLARRKQSLSSMPIAQRVRWWATDALISPGNRLGELRSELAKNEVRIRHLAEFLKPMWRRSYSQPSVLSTIRDPATLEDLIWILGRWCSAPPPRFSNGFVTLGMDMSELISTLIDRLGKEPGEQAERTLKRLIADPELEGWRPHLQRALEGQRIISRDASYKHPDLYRIQETLNDGPPANAADLTALLQDRIDDFQRDLQGGDTDTWRQFWNEDQYGGLTEQKPENSCRDALASNLKLRLPDDVELMREVSHAANTRADVQGRCGGFKVPVEIKRDSHRELWTAMRDQLMANYTTDPATDGYGIYLVLWFADQDKPVTRRPGGTRPSSPEELKKWLAEELSPEEARKISVIVLDVTKPARASGSAPPTRVGVGADTDTHP